MQPAEIEQLFSGWREDLVTCRKFAPAARNYAVACLGSDLGLRINEARMLDLDDVRWELGRFGKLLRPHVLRHFCASQLYLGGMKRTVAHAAQPMVMISVADAEAEPE